jgi:hypothetical protein
MENHSRIISRNSIEPVERELLLNQCSLIIQPYFAKIRSLYLEPPQSQPVAQSRYRGAGGEKNERLDDKTGDRFGAAGLVACGIRRRGVR